MWLRTRRCCKYSSVPLSETLLVSEAGGDTIFQSLQTWKHDTVEKRDPFIPLSATQYIYTYRPATGSVWLQKLQHSALSYSFQYFRWMCKACNSSSSFGNEWIFWNQEFNMFFRRMSTQNLPVTSTQHFCSLKYKNCIK